VISKEPAGPLLGLVPDQKPSFEEPPQEESARRSRLGDRHRRRHSGLRPGSEGDHHVPNRPRHLRHDHPVHRDGRQPDPRQRGGPQLRVRRDRPVRIRADRAGSRGRNPARHCGLDTAFGTAAAGAGHTGQRAGQARTGQVWPHRVESHLGTELSGISTGCDEQRSDQPGRHPGDQRPGGGSGPGPGHHRARPGHRRPGAGRPGQRDLDGRPGDHGHRLRPCRAAACLRDRHDQSQR